MPATGGWKRDICGRQRKSSRHLPIVIRYNQSPRWTENSEENGRSAEANMGAIVEVPQRLNAAGSLADEFKGNQPVSRWSA